MEGRIGKAQNYMFYYQENRKDLAPILTFDSSKSAFGFVFSLSAAR
jgi:hypothetical protein